MGRAVQVEFLLAGVTNSSGNPLASGKVYTYEAGTTTAKTTYTDQGKTTSAANPVILGTRGETSIFAEGAYKFVVKDSSDATLFTVDGLQYVYPDSFNVYAGTSTGSANAYVLTPSPASTGYVDGNTYTFIANFATTGASTINVSGLGAKSFVRNDGTTALGVGDILVSTLVNAIYISGSNHFRLVSTAGVVALSGGGTGSATAAGARTNLGLGSIATQAASAVAITGGTIAGAAITTSSYSGSATITSGSVTGITDITVADGGTGSSTAAGARSNLSAAVTGANNDITSLATCSMVTAPAQLDLVATGANVITFWSGGVDKTSIPAGTITGSVGLQPNIDNWYILGSSSKCWQTVYTVGVLGRAGAPLVLASVAGQDISIKAGNSTVWWTFTSAGKLVWASAPDYTVDGAYVPTRSLNPAVATVANCANAINTIYADLIVAGLFT